jgi:hypothetical protein
MHLTIQGEWQAFEAAVVPPDAGGAQRRDMFMAFFAGVEYVVKINVFIATLSDPAALAILDHLNAEVEAIREVMAEVNEQRNNNDELH